MLLLEEARAVNHAEPSSGKNGFGVPDTVRLELCQAFKERCIQFGQPHFGVHGKDRVQVLGPQPPPAGLFKSSLEFRDSIGGGTKYPRPRIPAATPAENARSRPGGAEARNPK